MADEYKEKYFRRCSCIMDFFQHYQLNVLLKNQTYLLSMLYSYCPRSKMVGGVSRRGKSERRSSRWKSKPLSRQCGGHKWPFQVDSGKSYFCLCWWQWSHLCETLECISIKCLCSLVPKTLEDPKSRALKGPGELILSFGGIIPKCDGRLAPACYLRTLHTGDISNAIMVLTAYKCL